MKRETWKLIHDLGDQSWSKRAIARKVNVSRATVRRALDSKQPPRHAGSGRRSVLEGHLGWIKSMLENNPDISAARIHAILKDDRQLVVSSSTVREHVSRLRPKAKKAFLTLHFEPGECAQVDWGNAGTIEINGHKRRLSLFVMVLAHSRMLYAELCLSEKMEYWLAAHRRAFDFFGGVPRKVMHDNLKTAVVRNLPGQPAEFNEHYSEFAGYYAFTPVACTPYRPNQKGRVENGVGYIKKAFVKGRKLEHFPALQDALSHWLRDTANRRIHGTTGCIPAQIFHQEERQKLLPLPLPYDCCVIRSCQANSQFRVTVDTNRYSVPAEYASRRLLLHLYDNRIVVYDKGRQIAEHLRWHGRKKDILKKEHERDLRERGRYDRRREIITTFLALGDGAAEYLDQLRERHPDWSTHAARINTLANIYGRDEAIRALRDTAESKAYSGDYVHHLLLMRSRLQPYRSPLHVTRREDLLNIESPKADLDVYKA
jgi:transposase